MSTRTRARQRQRRPTTTKEMATTTTATTPSTTVPVAPSTTTGLTGYGGVGIGETVPVGPMLEDLVRKFVFRYKKRGGYT